jgi:hypothetical protein
MNEIELTQNPFAGNSAAKNQNALVEVEQSRAIAETQAAMAIAKRFPRNQIEAMDRILNACTRQSLAESSLYTYSRGGTNITGPSIRLAETIAQNWGNLQFGIRELDQADGCSTVEAFAWDIETNVKQVKVFQVQHKRYTKTSGNKTLSDPRDIYEHIANNGARRLRACILGVIPGDVVEAAVNQCNMTLTTKAQVTPERIQGLLDKFSEFGVTKGQIEKRVQRRIDAITPALMVSLGKIYNSLKDGMSVAQDWFDASIDLTNLQNSSGSTKEAKPAETSTESAMPQVANLPDKETIEVKQVAKQVAKQEPGHQQQPGQKKAPVNLADQPEWLDYIQAVEIDPQMASNARKTILKSDREPSTEKELSAVLREINRLMDEAGL